MTIYYYYYGIDQGERKKNILIAINFMGIGNINIIQYSSSVILFGEFTRVEHVQW